MFHYHLHALLRVSAECITFPAACPCRARKIVHFLTKAEKSRALRAPLSARECGFAATCAALFASRQLHDTFDMARYLLIDVGHRESIRANMVCTKISPFVRGNISINSAANIS